MKDFREAKKAIEETFNASSAPEIVAAVLRHDLPRDGVCANGFSYSVHGIGYTVTLPDGGQVHLDGSRDGDFFKVYGLAFYLESSSKFEEMDISAIKHECAILVERGEIHQGRKGDYYLR
ncbi:hypothetical protein AB0C96_21860 [Streptomyces sp. NPDC048506]|uniref:DUF6896 domain-containing protein n=1 Tax=Streptomyces sp. NPDC048506 TaxID=3155028 RepID=UPI00343ED935